MQPGEEDLTPAAGWAGSAGGQAGGRTDGLPHGG